MNKKGEEARNFYQTFVHSGSIVPASLTEDRANDSTTKG